MSDDPYHTAAGVVRRYRDMLETLDGELAEIEAGIRALRDVEDAGVRSPRLRVTAMQMVDVLKRMESGTARMREALEALVRDE